MTAYMRYGSYQHPDWEMNLAQFSMRTRFSPRGRTISRIYTMRLEGEVQSSTGPDGITSRLQEIINAYFVQNQDAQFYVDGSLTPHYLPNSDSISGVKVLELAHMNGDAAEYANKRTLTVVLQSEQEDVESQLIQWDETVQIVGTCGPRYDWFVGFERPKRVLSAKRTLQTIIQTGSAIGWAGYVLPPGPLYPLLEQQELRDIKPGQPRQMGQALRLFPVRWSHTFISDAPLSPIPNIR